MTCWSIFLFGFCFYLLRIEWSDTNSSVQADESHIQNWIYFFTDILYYFLLNPKNVYTSFNFPSITHHLTFRTLLPEKNEIDCSCHFTLKRWKNRSRSHWCHISDCANGGELHNRHDVVISYANAEGFFSGVVRKNQS